jgi:hypothetical protein
MIEGPFSFATQSIVALVRARCPFATIVVVAVSLTKKPRLTRGFCLRGYRGTGGAAGPGATGPPTVPPLSAGEVDRAYALDRSYGSKGFWDWSR